MGVNTGKGLVHDFLAITYIFYTIVFFITSTSSCNDSKISDKKNNRIDDVKYKSKLTWMGHYEPSEKSRHRLIKEVEREFRLRNQEIELKLVFPSQIFKGWEEQNEYIASMVKSGDYKYDIIEMEPNRYWAIGRLLNDPDWGEKYLVDFSEMDWFKERHQSFIYSNNLIRIKTSNIMPCPYLEGVYGTLWINTKVLAKIGGSLKQFNLTIKDIHDLLNKLKTYNESAKDKIAFIDVERGYNSIFDLSRVLFLSAYFGETEKEGNMDAALKALKLVVEEFEYLQQQTHLSNPVMWGDISHKPIMDDKALMASFPTYAFIAWQSLDSADVLKIVPCELPIFEHNTKYYPGYYQGAFGVMKNSPNVELSIKLIKYLCSESVAERWLMYSKSPTGLKTRITSS
jgi:ABC-type glycerol-3-phosphate transport system substrate-binding protein